MRILAIRGSDLASLAGPFAVELDREPLARAGLFAISGPTGAGKSTLLDALCLALYDRVPRLEGPAGPGVGRAEDSEVMRLRATDVRGILRRGSASGFAEVEFRGRDRRRWRARWQVHRARRRPDGRLQEQEMTLEDVATGERVGRTKTEVLEAVADRVGLSWDQFRRSVLLAQGEFAAFLRATAAERAGLLERLTGTELYGRVSIAAHERARAEIAALEALEGRLADTSPLGDDERAVLESRRADAAGALAAAREAEGRASAALQWHRVRERLGTAVRDAEAAAAAAGRAWEEAEPRRRRLAAARAAEALRGPVEAGDAADRDLADREARAVSLAAAAEGAERSLAEATAALASTQEAERAAAAALEGARPELDRAARLDAEIDVSARELAAAGAADDAVRTRLAETTTRLEGVQAEAEGASRRRDEARAWLAEHAASETLAGEWPRWRDRLERLRRSRREAAAAEEALAQLLPALETARADAAAALRGGLVDGEPCPVCGATDHPWRDRRGGASGALDWRTLESQRAGHEAALRRAESEAAEAVAILAPVVEASGDGADALDGDLGRLAARWAERVDAWRARTAAVGEAESALADLRPRLAAAQGDLRHAEHEAAESAAALERRRTDHRQRTEARAGLLGGEPAREVRARLEGALAEARAADETARARRAAAAAAGERARALAERAAEELEAARERALVARELCDRRLAAAGLGLEEVRAHLARPPGWIEGEERSLAALDEERRRTAAVLEERRERLGEHESAGAPDGTAADAEAAHRQASAAVGAGQRALAEAEGALAADDERRRRAAALAREHEAQRVTTQLWAGLRELVGSHDGAKLRTFAQGLTLDALLSHANHHLGDLVRRYRLERIPGTDLELQVVDREMADEVRAVQSLSGGESFLVSLALALGLASLASSRVSVESLFVDEGFGSLDADALDAALAGLDALQAMGRQIGVISHVPAMVERIGVQVRVEPRGGGRSALRVVDAAGGPLLPAAVETGS